MKKMYALAFSIIFLAACKKEKLIIEPEVPVPHPVMQYLDLHDEPINFRGVRIIDIDNDGIDDLLVSTLLVGDAILRRDRRQYYISSGTESRLLQDANDQSPMLNKNEQIRFWHQGYEWFEVTSLLIAEKIVPEVGNTFWQGTWKQANHKYLPVQLKKNGNFYNGWIEISFDTVLERAILHRAAVCTEAGKAIKAGF